MSVSSHRVQSSTSCGVDVDLALEARATDTNSRYQLLDLENNRQKFNWFKNKGVIIIGILVISILLAGTVSFLIVYNQNQNLEVELDKFEEIAQSDEAPYIHSNSGVVVVKDPRDNNNKHNDDGAGSTTEKPSKARTTTENSSEARTTTENESGMNANTEIVPVANDDGSDETSKSNPVTRSTDPVSYFYELKNGTATFLLEECTKGKSRYGFKSTVVIEIKPIPQRNFTGYGLSKSKAKKTAAEFAALKLFNLKFEAQTEKDSTDMAKVKTLCENEDTVLESVPLPKSKG